MQGLDRNFSACGRQRVDQLALIVVQFAFGGLQECRFDGALRVLWGGEVLAKDPFLADHAFEEFARDSGGGAEGLLADRECTSAAIAAASLAAESTALCDDEIAAKSASAAWADR